MAKEGKPFNIIYRVCDSCENYNSMRIVGPKKNVVRMSIDSLKKAISAGGGGISLHVIFDNTSEETKEACRSELGEIAELKTYCTEGNTGNMASFKMAYEIAKTLTGFIFFLEDDYLLAPTCIREMRWFMSRFDDNSHVCTKPHHDKWTFTRDNDEQGRYFEREVLLGRSIYWIRDRTSTCTFCIDDHILGECSDLFEKTFLLDRVREDYLNQIYMRFPLFCCIPPQGLHYQNDETFNPFVLGPTSDATSYSQSKCRQ